MNMKNMMGNVGKLQAAMKNFEVTGRYSENVKISFTNEIELAKILLW
jgi:hypothetical protein